MVAESILDSEDFLFDSLTTLYDYHPITLTTSGTTFSYVKRLNNLNATLANDSIPTSPITINLRTPDTDSANWSLHASSIWVSSVYLADHIENLEVDIHRSLPTSMTNVRILELGASAGLPSILLAKAYTGLSVIATDYPDEQLISTLTRNVEFNSASNNCQVMPYAWGSDPTLVIGDSDGFDIVIAADTLWNPELHDIFIHTLRLTLKRTTSSRIHLIAGLHTGRYTLQSFMDKVVASGFSIDSVMENEVATSTTRQWDEHRETEDEKERRKWIVWIKLKWKV